MKARPPVILGSGSHIRARILSGAGVVFDIVKPDVDEDGIKKEAARDKLSIEDTAMRLAEIKTLAVSAEPTALVIGADQILEFEGNPFDKPTSMDEAAARLETLAGKTHSLVNAVSMARDGEIIWRNLDRPRLTIRDMTRSDINAYLSEAGPSVLSSVGAYQVEALGARLFDKIEGDYFAVLGLSLFPLLKALRDAGALEY